MDKVLGLLNKANPNQDANVDDGIPWYFKYGSRALGIVGAFFCVLFGLWNCLGILLANVMCFISGIIQILIGFMVMAIEAPFCCMFIDHVQVLSAKIEEKPLYIKAAIFCVSAVIPVLLCLGLGSIFACGLVFASGVIYGMMGLGKKASREDMAAAATADQTAQSIPSNDQSNILIEDPDVWK